MKKILFFFSLFLLFGCTNNGELNKDQQSNQNSSTPTPLPKEISYQKINTKPTDNLLALGLKDLYPDAYISPEWGQVRVSLSLTAEQRDKLPQDSFLQVWLLDEEKANDRSSFSLADEQGGEALINNSEYQNLPYPQLLGVLLPVRDADGNPEIIDGNYQFSLVASHRNKFTPYDRLLITLETNLSNPSFNPRPGTALWLGEINSSNEEITMERIPNSMVVMHGDTEINSLTPTSFAENSNLIPSSQSIKLSKAYGKSWIILNYDTAPKLPKGAVMEAWLIDYDSANNADKEIGESLVNWDQASFAFSLGKLLEQPVNPESPEQRSYVSIMSADMPMTGFDEVVITLETDGNEGNYDPRPGIKLFGAQL